MDKPMVWAGLISLLIGFCIIWVVQMPTLLGGLNSLGIGDYFNIIGTVGTVVGIMIVAAGGALLLYGLGKDGIIPPPPR